MKATFLGLAILGTALALATTGGCSDRSPTQPALSSSSSLSGAELEESVRLSRSSRPSTRVLPPRNAMGPGVQLLQAGTWGTVQSPNLDNRLLTVTAAGATFRSECASGAVETAILIDSAGRFDASGTFQIQAGPVGQSRPARFVGSAVAGTLTFRILLTDDNEILGPYTLTFGQAPQIGYCPIV